MAAFEVGEPGQTFPEEEVPTFEVGEPGQTFADSEDFEVGEPGQEFTSPDEDGPSPGEVAQYWSDVEEQELRRKALAGALSEAESPHDRVKARAMVKIASMNDPSQAPDDLLTMAEGGRPGAAPGYQTPFMRGIETMDAALSPFARPGFAMMSASADINALRDMTYVEAKDWADGLHRDDPRKDVFTEYSAAIADPHTYLRNKQTFQGKSTIGDEGVDLGSGEDQAAQVHKDFAKRLAAVYELPTHATPYGGTGLPHPWQMLDEQGRPVEGSLPADTTDIFLRGTLGGRMAPGDFMKMRRGVQTAGSALGRDAPAIAVGAGAPVAAAAGTAALGPLGLLAAPVTAPVVLGAQAWSAKEIGQQALAQYARGGAALDPESESARAIASGDTREGLLGLELAAMILPDFLTGKTPLTLAMGAGRAGAGLRTGSGFLTRAGDQVMQSQVVARTSEVTEDVVRWWRAQEKPPIEGSPEVHPEWLGERVQAAAAGVQGVFAKAFDDAMVPIFKDGRSPPSATLSIEDAARAVDSGEIVGFRPGKRILDIDTSDAVRLDRVTGEVVVDHSKVVVKYAPDPVGGERAVRRTALRSRIARSTEDSPLTRVVDVTPAKHVGEGFTVKPDDASGYVSAGPDLDRSLDAIIDDVITRSVTPNRPIQNIDLSEAITVSKSGGIETDLSKVVVEYGDPASGWMKGVGVFAEESMAARAFDTALRSVASFQVSDGGRYWLAGALEKTRGVMGKGAPLAVLDEVSQQWRPVRASSMMSVHRWQHFRASIRRYKWGRNFKAGEVDLAISNILYRVASKKDRQVANAWAETMGGGDADALVQGDLASRVLAALRKKAEEIVSAIPAASLDESWHKGAGLAREARKKADAAAEAAEAAAARLERAESAIPSDAAHLLDEVVRTRKEAYRLRKEAARAHREAASTPESEAVYRSRRDELRAIEAEEAAEIKAMESANRRFKRAFKERKKLVKTAATASDELESLRSGMQQAAGFIRDVALRFKVGSGFSPPPPSSVVRAAVDEARAASDDLTRLLSVGDAPAERFVAAEARLAEAEARAARLSVLEGTAPGDSYFTHLAKEDRDWVRLVADEEGRVRKGFVLGEDVVRSTSRVGETRDITARGTLDVTDEELELAIELLDADGVEMLLREGATAERLAAALEDLAAKGPRTERRISRALRDQAKEQLRLSISGERAEAAAGAAAAAVRAADGQVFYRGTNPGDARRVGEPFEAGKGLTFMARREDSAKMYGRQIERIVAKPDARILTQEDPAFWRMIGRRRPPNGALASAKGGVIGNVNSAITRAKAAGYDAVSFTRDSDIGTVIINESAFTRDASLPGKAEGAMAQAFAEALSGKAAKIAETVEGEGVAALWARYSRAHHEARTARESLEAANKTLSEATTHAAAADDAMRLMGDIHDGLTGGAMSLGKLDLDDPVVSMLRQEMLRGVILRDLMRDITRGAPISDASRKELQVLDDQMSLLLRRSDADYNSPGFQDAVARMTLSEARRAESAVGRRGGGEAFKKEWEELPDHVKGAVLAIRKFYDDAYVQMKAAGVLPSGWSRSQFLERMRVEGYINHSLTRSGAKALANAGKKWGVEFDATKMRGREGSLEDINEHVRHQIAEKVYLERVAQGVRNIPGAAPVPPVLGGAPRIASSGDGVRGLLGMGGDPQAGRGEAIEAIIREMGLDKVQFFETDAARLMRDYGRGLSRAVANQRWLNNMKMAFPEGTPLRIAETHATRFPFSTSSDVDEMARAMGWRRLPGSAHIEMLLGDVLPSAVWRKHQKEIDIVLANAKTDAERIAAIDGMMAKMGVDTSSQAASAVRQVVVKGEIYLPESIADFATRLHDTRLSKGWDTALGPFDDMLAFFKMSVTVGAVAFHGRNYISNAMTSLMVTGPAALNPFTHIEAIRLLAGKLDGSELDLGKGGVQTVEKIMGGANRLGVRTRNITLADVDRGSRQLNVNIGAAFKAGAVGGSLGFVGGLAAPADNTEQRLKHGLVGMMGGAYMGASVRSLYDVVFSRAVVSAQNKRRGMEKVGKEFTTADLAAHGFDAVLEDTFAFTRDRGWKAGLEDVVEGVVDRDKRTLFGEGVNVGAVGTAMWATADVMSGGSASLAGSAAVFTSAVIARMGAEGLFMLGGGVGQAIEQQWRMANYLAGLKKGLSEDASASLVHRALFDYDDLTVVERHFLRRVFPFWTWTSKNAVELQPWLLKNRPRESQILNKLLMAAGQRSQSDADLSLLREEDKWRFVVNTQMGRLIAGFGIPVEEFIRLFRTKGDSRVPVNLTSMIRPEVQFIQRFFGGTHPYFGVPLVEIRNARDARWLPTPLQKWVGLSEELTDPRTGKSYWEVGHYPDTRGEVRPDGSVNQTGKDYKLGTYRMAMLQSLPPWRLYGEYVKLATDAFLSGSTSSTTLPETGRGELQLGWRLAAFFTGVKPRDLDWDKLDESIMYRLEDELKAQDRNEGLESTMDIQPKQRRFRKDMVRELLSPQNQ